MIKIIPVILIFVLGYILKRINQKSFFEEIRSILKPDGKMFIIEPKFHVSKKAFENTIDTAGKTGLKPFKKEKVFFSRAIVLKN